MFPVAVDLMGGSEQGGVWETAEDPPKASNPRPFVNGGGGKRRE